MEGSIDFDDASSGQGCLEGGEDGDILNSDYNAKLVSLLEGGYIDETEYDNLLK